MTEIKPGKGKFKVVGGVAVVRTLDGSERYVYKGGVFDAAQADVVSVKHLQSVGLIEKVRETNTQSADAKAKADAAAEAAAKAKAEEDAEAAAKAKAEEDAKAQTSADTKDQTAAKTK